MISRFDDFPIHQTVDPVNQPGTSDRNFYDRYWFNGLQRDGEATFEAGVGIYPNRQVMDAHFSAVVAGKQFCFHASRRAPKERAELRVGPLTLEISEPLRAVRLVIAANPTGIRCDLSFSARTAAVQEPRNVMYDDLRLIMNTTRFTQAGCWTGSFTVNGKSYKVRPEDFPGLRDRSWGLRPVGEPETGAPGLLTTDPAVYWVWAPMIFDDCCTHFATFEDRTGNPTQLNAAIVPLYPTAEGVPEGEDPGRQEMTTASHRITWAKGTRRPEAAKLELVSQRGERHRITVTPLLRFQMLGIGYQHSEWGHGFWKGEEVVGSECWDLDELNPLEFRYIHAHHVCRARMGEREGIGTLETLCFGPHEPSGFKELLDGAP